MHTEFTIEEFATSVSSFMRPFTVDCTSATGDSDGVRATPCACCSDELYGSTPDDDILYDSEVAARDVVGGGNNSDPAVTCDETTGEMPLPPVVPAYSSDWCVLAMSCGVGGGCTYGSPEAATPTGPAGRELLCCM